MKFTINARQHLLRLVPKDNAASLGSRGEPQAGMQVEGRRIAVTGASGSLGRALLLALHRRGARPMAISRRQQPLRLAGADHDQAVEIPTLTWSGRLTPALEAALADVDVLVINHGVNLHSASDGEALRRTLEVNLLSALELTDLFLRQSAALPPGRQAQRELWVNTSEAEVNPTFCPYYEISKRSLGALLDVRAIASPCPVRRLVLGPFRSALNPIGVMDPDWVAESILRLIRWNLPLVIVSINPLTYVLMPLRWILARAYLWLCGVRRSRT